MTHSIDIQRLDKVRSSGNKLTARCPACAAAEDDKHGAHFFLNLETGQFGCAKFPGDSEHRREIFALVGIKKERDPAEERRWRTGRVKMAAENHARSRVSAAVRNQRKFILDQFSWSVDQVKADSPEKRIGWLKDPRKFIAALFHSDDVVWTGETRHSGQDGKHAQHWHTVEEWQHEQPHTVGPMISPCTWNPGETSRAAANVKSAPYVVLDFDGFDGKPPNTPDELRQHIAESLAITRWMRDHLEWRLAAVLFTGSKSIHAWFHSPSQEAIQSLKHTADALGVDAGLIGRPEHPCRLPCWLHGKTGKPSRVLWIQEPPTNQNL